MANAYTDTSAVSNLVQTAYDRLVEFNLRAEPLFRDLADKRPGQQAMPGQTVTMQLYQDLAKATSALSEDVDPDAVAFSNTNTVSITLNEYGNAALETRKLRLFSLSDVDPALADAIAFNMQDSLDENVQTVLRQGTNVIRVVSGNPSTTAAITAITNTDGLNSKAVRLAVTQLRTNKAVPRKGGLYFCGLHPQVSHDLRAETGAGGWRTPHEYSANQAIWAGEIGQYEGAFFVESPRNYNAVDGGSGGNTVRNFRTYVAGKQALAEAVAEEPHVVIGPVVDKLMRFRPIGWYGALGWARYREAALFRIETTSTVNSS